MGDGLASPMFEDRGLYGDSVHKRYYPVGGMSKRFYAAVHVAQGLVSKSGLKTATEVAERAFKIADALLKEEDKK